MEELNEYTYDDNDSLFEHCFLMNYKPHLILKKYKFDIASEIYLRNEEFFGSILYYTTAIDMIIEREQYYESNKIEHTSYNSLRNEINALRYKRTYN